MTSVDPNSTSQTSIHHAPVVAIVAGAKHAAAKSPGKNVTAAVDGKSPDTSICQAGIDLLPEVGLGN